MSLEIRRLSHALGAEISGVDLRKPLDAVTFDEIHRAFLEHCVLLFRGQALTRAQHVDFSRRFGELDLNEAKLKERTEEHPEIILVVSRPKPNGEPASGRYTGQEWHTDRSNHPVA